MARRTGPVGGGARSSSARMQLLNVLLIAAAHAASERDKVPVPWRLKPSYHTNLYRVASISDNHYDEHGAVVPPAVKGNWDVKLELVPDAAKRAFLAADPLIKEVWDVCVEVVKPFEPKEINAAKVYGDSTIYITTSIKDGAATQFYTGRKRIGVMVEKAYVGSISSPLVVERIFDQDNDQILKFNCGVVSAEDAPYVEGLSYRGLMTKLGKGRRHLCMQMPIGWVARFGLHPDQIAYINSKPDGHKLRDLLEKKGGQKIGWYGPPVVGRMSPEAAAAHTLITNAGLIEHGHPGGLVEIGLETQFKPGRQGRFPGDMPNIHAPTYMLIANIAFECARFRSSKDRDACIPQWLSESGVVTAQILRQPQFKKPFEFDLEGESYRIVGANARMTLPTGSHGNEERYVFDAVSGDEWDESYILPAQVVCVGLGLLDDDEVPPSSPYRDADKMFRRKAFKPWPDAFARKGRFAPIEPGTEFVDDDKPHGIRWVIFREGTERVNTASASAKNEDWKTVPVVYYCKPGSKPTERNYKAKDGPCEWSTADEVRKWMQQTQEGINVEARPKKRRRGSDDSDDSAGAGKIVGGLGGIFLTLAAIRLGYAGRRRDDDDVEAPAPRRPRRGAREHEN